MMRIVAGTFKGMALAAPKGERTRPTAAKVRAALGNALAAYLDGAAVLDLYAGTGGLGLELVSRGARAATFVESDSTALKALRANVSAARSRTSAQLTVLPIPVVTALPGLVGPFDIVIADPPYEHTSTELSGHLRLLVPLLSPGADVIVERATRAAEVMWPPGIKQVRVVGYGDTALCYGRAS